MDIRAARPGRDDVVYIERRGNDYAWRRIILGGDMEPCQGELPRDVWLYYAGPWFSDEQPADRWCAFFDDLLEEMESMAGGKDRCRWPFDEPWPHRH